MKKQSGYFTFAWLLFFSFFFVLMAQLTLRYLPFSQTVAFLQIKQTEVNGVASYLPIFYVHVYTAIFCLLAGFTQFNHKLLAKYKKLHRAIGYLYVLVVVFLAGPSGVYMGWYANGGWTARISFILLGLLWIFFTLKALGYIKQGNIKKHRQLMLRSFALAFSAITLRLWKVILVYLFHPAPMDVYQIIAWLGWIPNLLIVEYLIRKDRKN
ncbi:DUF2306 domain-containing protein [Pedobacter sp. KR3-3]|uniref:DUF2306 domain-containing protein n=1 Tax=Pedobacter albus TaxID=3113905 RepID=A0ABU7ICC8_9SPHI|nr:DUF2306 domain-containing protein [Pedobacter sp. KR3-3]MEE1947138.1 DUF2306 domain-containing protein [Pedobacter sp. KR3-3]